MMQNKFELNMMGKTKEEYIKIIDFLMNIEENNEDVYETIKTTLKEEFNFEYYSPYEEERLQYAK